MSFDGDQYAESGASVVMTTKGDLVRYNAARERLGIGSANQILQVKSSLPSWQTVPLADTVLTTQGDILYQDAAGLQRLAASTSGFLLTTKGAGANPEWAASSGGSVATDILVQENNTTIGDYSTPSGSTCSSAATSPASPDYETDFSSATGWSANTSHIQIDTANSEMDWQLTGTYTDEEIYHDLTTVDNSKWILRCKVTFDNIAINGTPGQANEFKFGIYDISNPSGETPSADAIFFTIASGSSSIANAAVQINGGSRTTTATQNTPFSTSTATSTDFYCQLTRESTTSITYKVFTDSAYSIQLGSTITHATTSGVTSLRYVMARIYSQTVSGAGINASISDVKFWNAINDINVPTNPCSNAIDDNAAGTYWKSASETNPNIYVDMGSAAIDSNIAIYPHSDTTETEVTIQSSTDATNWTTRRTILTANWTNGAYNYIRFNNVNSQYWRIYGNSGASVVLAINEIKAKSETDADILDKHGHLSISTSDTSLNNAGT